VAVLVSAKGFYRAAAQPGTHGPANKRLIVAVHGGRAGCGGCGGGFVSVAWGGLSHIDLAAS
jgi:hypothetical protein